MKLLKKVDKQICQTNLLNMTIIKLDFIELKYSHCQT